MSKYQIVAILKGAETGIPPRSLENLSVPDKQGECWSMDFMSDSSRNQCRFKTFNVIDDFNRDALGIDIAMCLPARRVSYPLSQQAGSVSGYPLKVRVDIGPEFTGKTFKNLAEAHSITIDTSIRVVLIKMAILNDLIVLIEQKYRIYIFLTTITA